MEWRGRKHDSAHVMRNNVDFRSSCAEWCGGDLVRSSNPYGRKGNRRRGKTMKKQSERGE